MTYIKTETSYIQQMTMTDVACWSRILKKITCQIYKFNPAVADIQFGSNWN